MSEVTQASFKFTKFTIKESHIVVREDGDNDFELSFVPSGIVFPSENRFELEIIFEAIDKNELVEVKVISHSLFKYSNIPDVTNSKFLTENASAIVFPYIRAYISTLTVQSGITPIILPTLNLTGMGETLKKNITVKE